MLTLFIVAACYVILPKDQTPIDTGEIQPTASGAIIDGNIYAGAHFVGDYLVGALPARDVVVQLDPDNYPRSQAWQTPVASAPVNTRIGARSRLVPGRGVWLSGDVVNGLDAVLVDPETLETIATIQAGVDLALHRGTLVSAYPGTFQYSSFDDAPGRLEAIAEDGSVTVLREEACGAVGFHCGDALIDVDGVLWWADGAGGLYTESGEAWHIQRGDLLPEAPVYGETPPAHTYPRLEALDNGRMWFGAQGECGVILDTRSRETTSYTGERCGYTATEGLSLHGSAVRIVTLDPTQVGDGAFLVEWLDGNLAGHTQVVYMPDDSEEILCWPVVTMGMDGDFAVTCDSRNLYTGRVTG